MHWKRALGKRKLNCETEFFPKRLISKRRMHCRMALATTQARNLTEPFSFTRCLFLSEPTFTVTVI